MPEWGSNVAWECVAKNALVGPVTPNAVLALNEGQLSSVVLEHYTGKFVATADCRVATEVDAPLLL